MNKSELLPLRESTTHYLKSDRSLYNDYYERRCLHFNKTYKKYKNYLERLCTKYVGKHRDLLASKLLSIKVYNKFEKQALEYVYGCLYGTNTYSNDLSYIFVENYIIKSKDNKRTRWSRFENNKLSKKPNYKTNSYDLIYRHNCYFYLIEKKDYYEENSKGEMVFMASKYLQLNKKELKFYNISN